MTQKITDITNYTGKQLQMQWNKIKNEAASLSVAGIKQNFKSTPMIIIMV